MTGTRASRRGETAHAGRLASFAFTRRGDALLALAFALAGIACSKREEKLEPVRGGLEDAGEMQILPMPRSAFPIAPPASALAALSPDARAARELFTARCVMCHGWEGRGDGPSARMLSGQAKLPDFTNEAWQATERDESWAAVIVKGGEATGHSRLMPANADLAEKPAVVKELVALLRGFAGKPSK